MGVAGICKAVRSEWKVALLAVAVLIAAGCAKLEPQIPTTTEGSGAGFADQELFGATIRLTREALPRLTLKTPHLRRFDAQRLMILEDGVEGLFYDNFGNRKATLNSDKGEIVEGSNRLSAKGHVVVVSDSGVTLHAEELHYDQAVGRIESEGFVTVVSQYDSLAGYGFSSAPDLTDWEIKNTSGATWRKFERDSSRADSAR